MTGCCFSQRKSGYAKGANMAKGKRTDPINARGETVTTEECVKQLGPK